LSFSQKLSHKQFCLLKDAKYYKTFAIFFSSLILSKVDFSLSFLDKRQSLSACFRENVCNKGAIERGSLKAFPVMQNIEFFSQKQKESVDFRGKNV
jgi:hypothetical protein